jgi:hypothetical protein
LYLPAGAAFASSVGGWYYAVFSNTTQGTIYNNVYTTGQPAIPSAPTPIIASGPGAFVGATAAILAQNTTLLGNSLGNNGEITFEIVSIANGSAGTKGVNPAIGATFVSGFSGSSSTQPSSGAWKIRNRGRPDRQFFADSYVGDGGYQAGNPGQSSVNTAIPQIVGVYITTSVATDWSSVEGFTITCSPMA